MAWLYCGLFFGREPPILSPEACLEKGVDRARNDINILKNNKIYIEKKQPFPVSFYYNYTIKGYSAKVKF